MSNRNAGSRQRRARELAAAVLGVWKTGKPKNPRVTGLHISRREHSSRTFAPPASLIAASAPYPNSLARDNRGSIRLYDPAPNVESSRDGTRRRVLERETRGVTCVPPSFVSSHVEQQANAASSMARTKDLHVAVILLDTSCYPGPRNSLQ